MGFLNKLFGGGTKLELRLDATQAPAGGILSGTLTLQGGKKDLTLTSLKVRLLYLLVRSSEESSMPEIDTRAVIDQTLAQGEAIPGGSSRDFEFSFQLPADLDPTGDGVSYKVMAAADIPKVADPTAEAKLTIVEGAGMDLDTLTLEDIYARWPDLRSDDDEALSDALNEVMLACYDERDGLMVIEPVLTRHIRSGSWGVRTAALEAWANLLDDSARKEHIALLRELAQDLSGDSNFRREVITAAAKFADEGALSLIKELAKSDDPEIREEVADQLRFAASDRFRGKLGVLESMVDDPSDSVRASVFGAFSDFRDKKKLMRQVAARIDSDPSEEVQAACIGTLAFLHHDGLGDITLEAYTKHLDNPHAKVRIAIAEHLNSFDEGDLEVVRGLAQRLVADKDPEVRRKTVWHFVNLSEFPALAPIGRHAAENDPDAEVRGDALFGLSSMMPASELVAFYRMRLAAEPSYEVSWGVLSGLRDHSDTAEGEALLRELFGSEHESVASAAREQLGED